MAKTKSYALNFTCLHEDKSKSNPFRVYDFPESMTPGECYLQAIDDIKDDDESVKSAIINDMVRIE